MRPLFKFFLLFYVLLNAFAWYVADGMLYQKTMRDTSFQPALTEQFFIPNGDTPISAVYYSKPSNKYTVLFSHGNRTNITLGQGLWKEFMRQGYNILAYDYPGFGKTGGVASEATVYESANAAWKYLTETESILPNRIIIFGHSLGTGPATELALAHQDAKALVLVAPFVSAYRVMTVYPVLLFDQYKNLSKISNVEVPVFIIHGAKDKEIAEWHGKALYNAANSRKLGFWPEDGKHSNIFSMPAFWDKLETFTK